MPAPRPPLPDSGPEPHRHRQAAESLGAEAGRHDRARLAYPAALVLDQLRTHPLLTSLPPDQAAEVLAGVGTAIDAIGGTFTMPYTTIAITATRTTLP